ncbi:hypothetical protein CTZ27_32645 [Streptomyces griseocarneus]|nr:hypothetical protein CTZ27_32645 [Streptomyces griseocarneus]
MSAPAHSAGSRHHGATALRCLAVAALCYGTGRLGVLTQVVGLRVTPVWPPAGVALAGLLLFGLRVWPGVLLGAFVNSLSRWPWGPALLFAPLGDTLSVICSYTLLRRVGFHRELDRLRDPLALILFGVVGTLISATVGVGMLLLADVLHGSFWPTWSVWLAGDTMGVLLVTPFLLVVASARRPRDVLLSRWLEGAALALAAFLVAIAMARGSSLLFLGFPLLIYAAFRFQRAGAAPCALVVSTFVTVAAAHRAGPFNGHDLSRNMMTLTLFNGAVSLTALLLAAAITERNRTQEEITALCARLSGVVTKLVGDESGHRPPPPNGP